MASPGWRFREIEPITHEFAEVCVHPHQPAPLPIFCPHQAQSEQWGSGSVLLAARGMWDWMVANLRLSGFIRPELAVSRGALEWTKGPP